MSATPAASGEAARPAAAPARVPLDKIDATLSKLWDEEAKRSGTSRMALLTVVALVSEPRFLERAKAVLAHVATVHPARTVAAVWLPGDGAPSIDAEVALHVREGGRACGDAIVLEARGAARDWLPETLDRLLLSGVPSAVWWVGDLPDADDLFDRTVGLADAVIVNSAEMDLRDLAKLSFIAKASKKTSTAVADLTWARLKGLQDLTARFFDDPEVRPFLDGLHRVTLAYSPREGEQDVASTQAGLYLGWLAAALGFAEEMPGWQREPEGGGAVRLAHGGWEVDVRILHDPRGDVPPGALTRIELVAQNDRGEARFEITRLADDPQAFRAHGEAPGVVIPGQTVRIHDRDEAVLLARTLELPRRDALLEASLEAGARIMRQVAPRISVRPKNL